MRTLKASQFFLIAAVALASAMPALRANAQATAQEEFRRGMVAYQKADDVAGARAAFLKAIERDKAFAAPVFNLAQLEEQQERWAEAVRWYTGYLRLDKTSLYADVAEKKLVLLATYIEADKTVEGKKRRIYLQYLQKAQTYLAGGNAGASTAYAELAANLEPLRFEAYVLHAIALMENERYTEALVKLDAAAARATGPEKAEIAALASRCREAVAQKSRIEAADKLFQQRNYPAAAAAYSDIWILLDQAEYGFLAAKSWALARQESKALRIYERLATAKAVGVVAQARREKASLEAALAATAAPAILAPAKPAAAMPPEFARASQLIASKDYYEADAKLTQVLDGVLPGPDYAVMFDARSVARLGMKEYLGAVQDATLAVTLNPRLLDAYVHRSQGHAGLGSYAEAARDLDRAIELSTDANARERLRAVKKQYLSKIEEKT